MFKISTSADDRTVILAATRAVEEYQQQWLNRERCQPRITLLPSNGLIPASVGTRQTTRGFSICYSVDGTFGSPTLDYGTGNGRIDQFGIRRINANWNKKKTHEGIEIYQGTHSVFLQYPPILANTVKPVYNDHLMGYFSAFWSSSRWPRAT